MIKPIAKKNENQPGKATRNYSLTKNHPIRMAPYLHDTYRADIDGLRAIAVSIVVGFHLFPFWLEGGFIGVDIFFVISGYLVTNILYKNSSNNKLSIVEFYGRRIRRIFPALIVVLLSSIAFGWFALFPEEYLSLGKLIVGSALFCANFFLWKESGYFDSLSITKPLLHLWSLGIEEQYYILWPVILTVALKKIKSPIATTLFLLIASFSINLLTVKQDEIEAFFLPQTRFWELLVGSILAIASTQFDSRRNQFLIANLCSVVGTFLILFCTIKINKETQYPGWWALFPTMGAALIIAAGQPALINRYILSNQLFVKIGLISYPIYLWHWPLLSFSIIVEGEMPSREIRIAILVMSLILAWLTYELIEKPLRNRIDTGSTNRYLIFIMITILLLGVTIVKYKGIDTRSIINESELYQSNRVQLTHPENIDENCLNYIDNRDPLFTFCRYSGSHYPRTVALFGDSHAHAAYYGFQEQMKNLNTNVVLLGNTTCPPFIGAEIGFTDLEKSLYCKERIEQALDIIKSKNDIKEVYYFSRGPIYIIGKSFGDLEKILQPPHPISPDIFFSSLQQSINLLNESGKKVYYVTENPELEFSPVKCIPRAIHITETNCMLEKKRVMDRQYKYLKELEKLKNVQVINTTDIFCPDDQCQILKDGTLLYSDFDHLSLAGSKLQAFEIISKHIKNSL